MSAREEAETREPRLHARATNLIQSPLPIIHPTHKKTSQKARFSFPFIEAFGWTLE